MRKRRRETGGGAGSRLADWRRVNRASPLTGSVVVCPATWGRGDDPAEARKLGEGEIYPETWVRLPNHFVDTP